MPCPYKNSHEIQNYVVAQRQQPLSGTINLNDAVPTPTMIINYAGGASALGGLLGSTSPVTCPCMIEKEKAVGKIKQEASWVIYC